MIFQESTKGDTTLLSDYCTCPTIASFPFGFFPFTLIGLFILVYFFDCDSMTIKFCVSPKNLTFSPILTDNYKYRPLIRDLMAAGSADTSHFVDFRPCGGVFQNIDKKPFYCLFRTDLENIILNN